MAKLFRSRFVPRDRIRWHHLRGDLFSSLYAMDLAGKVKVHFPHFLLKQDIRNLWLGNVKWRHQIGVGPYVEKCSSPVLGIDGSIYIGSVDYNLYSFTADGERASCFEYLL